jgi:branched-chain amino acid transport system ATP-binding protein
MTEPILKVENLVKRFGGLRATNNLSFTVERGSTHAIIGPNGAGKTTMIKQLQGEIRPDAGRILFEGRDITRVLSHKRAHLGIARTFQITSVLADFTVFTNVALAVQVHLGHSFQMMRTAHRDATIRSAVEAAVDVVNLTSRSADLASELSHGERRQLELAIAIAMSPRVLLLDEPLAGMGRSDSEFIIDLLARLKERYTILLVEHDMTAVFALADTITVLVAGEAIASGTPGDIRNDQKVRNAYLGHS